MLLWLAQLTAMSPPSDKSERLPRKSSAPAQMPQDKARQAMRGSVGLPSALSQRRVPAGGWARASSPRPQPSPRSHRATSAAPAVAQPPVSPRPPSVLPTEGLPWCRPIDGYRRRFSYVIVFDVDLAGIVVVGDGDGDGGGGGDNPQHLRRGRAASVGGGIAAGLSAEACGSGKSDTTSSASNSSSVGVGGVGGGGDGDFGEGGRRGFSVAAGSDRVGSEADLQGGGASLLRLTVPRVAIRVCSPSSMGLPRGSGAGLGARPRQGGAAPTVTVTAKWLEGHLEMEDPGVRVVPPLPAPSQSPPPLSPPSEVVPVSVTLTPPSKVPLSTSPTASTLVGANTTTGGAGTSPPLSTSAVALSVSSSPCPPESGERDGEKARSSPVCLPAPAPSAVVDEAPIAVTAARVPSSRLSSGAGNDAGRPRPPPPSPPPTLLGATRWETHRLRWLAVRKLSFRMGEPASLPASFAGGLEGAGTSNGVPSADQTAGVRRSPPGGDRRDYGSDTTVGEMAEIEATEVEDDGLSVEGLWAEWSPALFFLAGKSGAMVRR